MNRPVPTPVLHFTRVEHLGSMVRHGILSDTQAAGEGLTEVAIGHPDIKRMRGQRLVPREPGGVVADYVPFYFAPRSPMLYVIERGSVPGYADGCARIVYLRSTLETLSRVCGTVLVTDRNAVKAYAEFRAFQDGVDDLVDWELMRAAMWNDTAEFPDRKERRMAEALVHGVVPWTAITEVATRSPVVAAEAQRAIEAAGSGTSVSVRPEWYF